MCKEVSFLFYTFLILRVAVKESSPCFIIDNMKG